MPQRPLLKMRARKTRMMCPLLMQLRPPKKSWKRRQMRKCRSREATMISIIVRGSTLRS